MITKVEGTYQGMTPRGILVQVGPFTLEILATAMEREVLSQKKHGEKVTMHTLFYIEGAVAAGNGIPILIGFQQEASREFFQLFTTVDGIGPGKALRALNLPTSTIAGAIEQNDMRTLSSLKGIGERTARKIVAELKGKTTRFTTEGVLSGKHEPPREQGAGTLEEEAFAVLLQLGYNPQEARRMIKETLAQNPHLFSAEELITEIYRLRTLQS